MKLSLRWIADHLEINWKEIDTTVLVQKFNTKVAEIESITPYKLDLSSFYLAKVVTMSSEMVVVYCPELKTEWSLTPRSDVHIDRWYLIKQNMQISTWATYADFYSDKEGLPRAFHCSEDDATSGIWRNQIEAEDTIIEIDNKTITHRPDMWSHRGVAREIALLLDVPLKKISDFIVDLPIISEKTAYKATQEFPFGIHIETDHCKRYAGLCVNGVEQQASSLSMGTRLMRLHNSAYGFFVDVTNYICLDLGQPMHAFDADTVTTKKIAIRMADKNEQLQLLKGDVIDLVPTDMIITDSQVPLVLAGIKGGINSGVSTQTTSLFVEAATFDASFVRVSATHHALRTESSMRFEKSLDPELTTFALERFIFLMQQAGIASQYISPIVSLGQSIKKTEIVVNHVFIEKRLGLTIEPEHVKNILQKLEFTLKEQDVDNQKQYIIDVPSFRATKDISLAQDIVEEIGRSIGYEKIVQQLPVLKNNPTDVTNELEKIEKIKNFLAFSAAMHEVSNHAFFDNTVIDALHFMVHNALTVANPIAVQRDRLVTSLIPHLLENIKENEANHEKLRFFEWARTWTLHDNNVQEVKKLAGIMYQKRGEVDFYHCKQILTDMFALLNIPVTWHAMDNSTGWSALHQVAQLQCAGKVIGYAGRVSTAMMSTIGGDACAFELDGDFLLNYTSSEKRYIQVPKYQATYLDISVMVPLNITVAQLETVISKADERIFAVTLQDIFTKQEWQNQKSVTLRYFVRDVTKTLEKIEINTVQKAVLTAITVSCQAVVR